MSYKTIGFVFVYLFLVASCESEKEVAIKATSSQIAIQNLESQLKTLSTLIEKKGSDIRRLQFVDLTLTKIQFFNNFDDLQKVQALVDLNSKDKSQIEINLKYLIFIHEYGKALSQVEKLNKDKHSKMIKKYKNSIKIARGKEVSEEVLKVGGSRFSSSIRRANSYAASGEFQKAEDELLDNLKSYKDVSPFPIAYIYFNLGLLWGEKGSDTAKAQKYYEKALKYLPGYSSATVHLSEIYIDQDRQDKALSLLLTLSENGDPEVSSTLAEIYQAQGDKKLGQMYKDKANRRYQELINQYPLAFYDHATEFYMGIGESPELAMSYALKNLDNRKNQRSYFLAIEASHNAGNKNLKCEILNSLPRAQVTYDEYKENYEFYSKECI